MGKRLDEGTASLRGALIGRSRDQKIALSVLVDLFGFFVCSVLAFWTVAALPISTVASMLAMSTLAAVTAVSLVWLTGLYRSIVRFVGLDLFLSAFLVSVGAASLLAGIGLASGAVASPFRWGTSFLAYAAIYLSASRYLASIFLSQSSSTRKRENILIYGAGKAGAQLTLNLRYSHAFRPVAIVDDDPTLHGKKVKGLEVYSAKNLEKVIEKFRVNRVLLAMPSAPRRRRRQILKRLSQSAVHVQTVPDIADIVSGVARVDEIKDLDVKDILGRDPVPPNPELLSASTGGKSVLVTGAAGSIGAELCRQILELEPARLILLEISESALYTIDRELTAACRELGSRTELVPLLGSVHHENRIREIIKTFKVQTIFHAAAYKHVPIVEQNLFEGIHNNIFGTLHTARAARDCGVERFVLISTDKAVNPTNVMGATKRMAEMILQALNAESPKTTFCMVRFGNVLESSGSVVPLFRDQIRSGGPVTVTHRDIIRYFMTIPEAAQLVIQAAALARGGDVFVLDMGEPVKIEDLANRMVNLMGLTVRDESNPDGDIDIEYIGLRPAEKLFEELLIGSNVSGTDHPRIMRADEDCLAIDILRDILGRLEQASKEHDYDAARKLLIDGVNEYDPANGIDDLLYCNRSVGKVSPADDRIVDFPSRSS